MQNPTYAPDTTLQLSVLAPRPVLQIQSHSLPSQLYAGQLGRGAIAIRNKGNMALRHLRVLCDRPDCLTFVDGRDLGT